MKTKNIACIFIIFIALVIFSGCGSVKLNKNGDSVTVSDGKSGVTVNTDSSKIEVKSSDGKTEVAISDKGVPLADGYPKDIVPIIDGAKITVSTKGEDPNKKITYTVQLEIDKESKEVYRFYSDALKPDNNELFGSETGKMQYSIAGKKGNYAIGVTIIGNADNGGKEKTAVFIGVGLQ